MPPFGGMDSSEGGWGDDRGAEPASLRRLRPTAPLGSNVINLRKKLAASSCDPASLPEGGGTIGVPGKA